MALWGGYHKLVLVTIFVLNVFSENSEGRSFGRRHQVKVLALADGEQDVQPMSNSDGPSLPSSENQQSTESLSGDKEKESLALTKSQETSRFSRERLSPRLRPSCASDVFQPEKRLSDETPKLAKLQEETAKVSKVENTEEATVPEIPQRKPKKNQKIRRQQKSNSSSDPENNENNASTLPKTDQSDTMPALPVELEPVKPAVVDKDVVPAVPENDDGTLTETELRKYRRSSRKKSKKVTTTTTTTPPPESIESSEETSEGDENEYAAAISDQDVPPEPEQGTKDEDPDDGPIAKALSDNTTDMGSVEKTTDSENVNSNEEYQAEQGTPSNPGRKKKDRRAKSKRPSARPNGDSQASYRQSRRRPNY